MARVSYALGVKKEIDDAIDYYEAAREGLGMESLVEVESAVEKFAIRPLRYRCIRNTFRRCLVNQFPYAIIFSYTEHSGHICIVAVMHTSLNPIIGSHELRINCSQPTHHRLILKKPTNFGS